MLSAHLLLGNQQHSGAGHQQTADHIEDGGAHAAGGGQLGAGVVLHIGDGNGSGAVGLCDGEVDRFGEQVVAIGRGGLNQLVAAASRPLTEMSPVLLETNLVISVSAIAAARLSAAFQPVMT